MALLGEPIPWVGRDARKGLYYTRNWRGIRVTCMWPRRRKSRRSALQRQLEYDFASVVLAIKWLDPTIISTYISAYEKSPALWRDQLMALLYGTAFALTGDEGQTIYPRQFWEKISKALDLLGAQSGAILIRSFGQWQTLAPGAEGSVLTSQGVDAPPTWL